MDFKSISAFIINNIDNLCYYSKNHMFILARMGNTSVKPILQIINLRGEI